jgi:hypothetical protein
MKPYPILRRANNGLVLEANQLVDRLLILLKDFKW